VAAFLRGVGLGGVLSSINPGHSNDLLKAALDKAAGESGQNTFWNKFLKNINAALPPSGGPSSMAMIRGGGKLPGLPRISSPKGAGRVKGAANDEERGRGETGDGVNLGGRLYGGLAGRFEGGGGLAGQAPYITRATLGEGTSAAERSSGMYNNVIGWAAGKVPVPGQPRKINTRRMGRVSGFTWRNVGYKTQAGNLNFKPGSKKPMFQLAEAFAMTASAYKSGGSAFEYQAARAGTTYDGTDANLDVIQTDAAAPVVPDNSYAGDFTTAVKGIHAAEICSASRGGNGSAMSGDVKAMEDILKTLNKKPKCCMYSAVDVWNAKIDKAISLCNDFNVNEAGLAGACQYVSSPMDCAGYNSMKIEKCSNFTCLLSVIFLTE
jgi:hypothetical protein